MAQTPSCDFLVAWHTAEYHNAIRKTGFALLLFLSFSWFNGIGKQLYHHLLDWTKQGSSSCGCVQFDCQPLHDWPPQRYIGLRCNKKWFWLNYLAGHRCNTTDPIRTQLVFGNGCCCWVFHMQILESLSSIKQCPFREGQPERGVFINLKDF